MPQIFRKSADAYIRLLLLGLLVVPIGGTFILYLLMTSPLATGQNITVDQVPPFSHAHHVAGLGIGCRMCHSQVERTAFAGMPATHVCMSCHSQIWTNAELLAPVRESLAQDKSLEWRRVARVPDYVYFRHDIHVQKGVGCNECHGRIDEMQLTYIAVPFRMRWCLDCHRDPEPRLRPKEEVTNMAWTPTEDRRTLGRRLAKMYGIHGSAEITHCAVCHR